MNWKYKAGLALAAFLAAGIVAVHAAAVEQRSVLNGKVVSVVAAGTAVKEGQVLATVETLAGPVPAVKATADGVVKEVKIHAGETVSQNTVAFILEAR